MQEYVMCPECRKEVYRYRDFCNYCGFYLSNSNTLLNYNVNEFEIKETTLIEYLLGTKYSLSDVTIANANGLSDYLYRNVELFDVEVPYGVTYIDGGAFGNCLSPREISIPNTVIEIGAQAFAVCLNLSNIKLSINTTKICDSAFVNCESLEKIELPNKLQYIGNQCFAYCKNLREITIPESVIKIGRRIFEGTDNLGEIYVSSRLSNCIKNDLRDEYPNKKIIEI